MPNFASDILVNVARTKMQLIYSVLVSSLFFVLVSLIDDNSKRFVIFTIVFIVVDAKTLTHIYTFK